MMVFFTNLLCHSHLHNITNKWLQPAGPAKWWPLKNGIVLRSWGFRPRAKPTWKKQIISYHTWNYFFLKNWSLVKIKASQAFTTAWHTEACQAVWRAVQVCLSELIFNSGDIKGQTSLRTLVPAALKMEALTFNCNTRLLRSCRWTVEKLKLLEE